MPPMGPDAGSGDADRSELDRERDALARSEQDIAAGEQRIERQVALLAEARTKGRDTEQAERLLRALRQTLEGWRQHHVQIVERIAQLETRVAVPEPD